MDDAGGSEIEVFRAEAQAWIAANFPPGLTGAMVPAIGADLTPMQDAWRKAMGAKGWGVPTWPSEYGGGGLTPALARVLARELARAGAYNPIGGMGVMLLGPTGRRGRARMARRISSGGRIQIPLSWPLK